MEKSSADVLFDLPTNLRIELASIMFRLLRE